MNKPIILFAVQSHELKQSIQTVLHHQTVELVEAMTCQEVLKYFQATMPQLLILESPCQDGVDTLAIVESIHDKDRRFPVILVTTRGSERLAISALRMGIKDYFEYPFSGRDLINSVTKLLSPRASKVSSTQALKSVLHHPFIGSSHSMQKVKTYLQKVAHVDSHVLITGETGTGKELVAKFIHGDSQRSRKPFIAINCAALPDSLLESELFGYEKGAFTGAQTAYAGKLKMADGGTVFFDEIGDMSPYAQAKILRVLESKEVYPLGAKQSVALDIRIIAATNRHLEKMMLAKEFRDDLYFRLNIARVHLPPLRERKEDIPELLNFYLKQFNQQFGLSLVGFSIEALEALFDYHWPGNIRELKNVLETVFIDSPYERISRSDLPEPIRGGEMAKAFSDQSDRERESLLAALNATNWNKSKAAEQLQCSRMTLYRKMEKHRIRTKKAF
ncbi:MAG: sigma-54-dependent Fis family transcriptional regulator [Gammaproteobacteria bacterium]|uniref:sigma 54-interacting transcriptional regulator n=1 Tax=Methylotuvimicrobium sp. TaxID=2822413 RepID=UPI001D81425E|nr:sigma-54-dependent Fis family transcriptional regulator [Gammaproteobacteria bacterium]